MSPHVRVGGEVAPVVRRRVRRSGVMQLSPVPYEGAGRQFMTSSDWWTNILKNATFENPNLDDPTNVATLRRIASRIDVISIVDPHWHNVGRQVRDRLRQYAHEQGRKITLLRYLGTAFVRWTDQAGHMSAVPSSGVCTDNGTIIDASQILTTAEGLGIRGRGAGESYFIDPNSAKVRSAAAANVVARAEGWDGIYLDEVIATYQWLRFDNTQQDPDYPVPGLAYENGRRSFIQYLITAIADAGKIVSANVDPYTTGAGGVHWPTAICQDNPALAYPFIEGMWAADWQRAPVTTAHSDWTTMQQLATWARWCETNGHNPVLNTYSTDPATLRYGAAMTLAYGGRSAVICGQAPNAATDEYADEPPWLPEYDTARALWSPTDAPAGSAPVTRHWNRGSVQANPDTGVGYVLGPGEEPPVVPTGPTPPAGTLIFSDDFTGTDGSAWDATKWVTEISSAGSAVTRQGGKGRILTGSSTPGQATVRYVNQIADLHALLKFQINGEPTPLIIFRAAQSNVDSVSAYSVEVWDWRLALVRWGADWADTVIGEVERAHTSGTEWYVRLYAVGSTLRVKSWLVGDPEPAAWDIDVTDTTYSTGFFGFNVWCSTAPAQTVTVDDLVVAQS